MYLYMYASLHRIHTHMYAVDFAPEGANIWCQILRGRQVQNLRGQLPAHIKRREKQNPREEGKQILFFQWKGGAVSIHWTGLLDWITGLTFDPQIPTKMSNFSAIDRPRLQLCPLLCQYILNNRLSSQIGPSNMFSSSA